MASLTTSKPLTLPNRLLATSSDERHLSGLGFPVFAHLDLKTSSRSTSQLIPIFRADLATMNKHVLLGSFILQKTEVWLESSRFQPPHSA